jgi:hypothetical protein
MELDAAIFGMNDDERRSEREMRCVTADDRALLELFEPFASDTGRMIQGWMLEDRGRSLATAWNGRRLVNFEN